MGEISKYPPTFPSANPKIRENFFSKSGSDFVQVSLEKSMGNFRTLIS